MSTPPLHQQIREQFKLTFLNHITHLDNLPGIIQSGCLHSYNKMRGQKYTNLANEDVQAGRAGISIPHTSRPLHDYVPFYFGIKTPMIAANQDDNEQIVYLQFSTNLLQTPGTVISDGNARSGATVFRPFTQLSDLDFLDVRAIHSVKYGADSELRRKKQAEALIPDSVSFSAVYNMVVFSEPAKTRVLAILQKSGISKTVRVNPGYYFTVQVTK